VTGHEPAVTLKFVIWLLVAHAPQSAPLVPGPVRGAHVTLIRVNAGLLAVAYHYQQQCSI